MTDQQLVEHQPVWIPADLPINDKGAIWPGYRCAHVLENGMGRCPGTTLDPADDIGIHACTAPAR